MGKKLLKTFTNNIGFKILAIAFAFILWLVVYNLNDPVKTKTFTTTVTVTGREPAVVYHVGETVKVNYGPFNGFSGIIEEVNNEKKKLKVMVKIFGRKTPLELENSQVERE